MADEAPDAEVRSYSLLALGGDGSDAMCTGDLSPASCVARPPSRARSSVFPEIVGYLERGVR